MVSQTNEKALSRLNRSAPHLGKKTEDLFILKFFNSEGHNLGAGNSPNKNMLWVSRRCLCYPPVTEATWTQQCICITFCNTEVAIYFTGLKEEKSLKLYFLE
jgi:hypothetical protein